MTLGILGDRRSDIADQDESIGKRRGEDKKILTGILPERMILSLVPCLFGRANKENPMHVQPCGTGRPLEFKKKETEWTLVWLRLAVAVGVGIVAVVAYLLY